MKMYLLVGLAIALLVTRGQGPACAQPPGLPLDTGFPMIVVVDEFCTGYWSDDGGITFQPLDCSLEQDPLSRIVVPSFPLPQRVWAGDVIAQEAGARHPSDMLRFPNISLNGTTDRMYFFSGQEKGNPADSDVGLPAEIQVNGVEVPEQGMPGVFEFFINSTSLAVYIAISEFSMGRATPGDLRELVKIVLQHAQPMGAP